MENDKLIILNKKLSPKGFLDYIDNLGEFDRVVNKIVLHHTSTHWNKWQGSASMLHYWNIYRSRGWTAGPHIFIAPDGIWLFTDIRQEGKHAGLGNAGSIGIEICGFYFDRKAVDMNMPERMKFEAALVLSTLMAKLEIDFKNIFRHVDFDKYTFCTQTLDREWARDLIEFYQSDIDRLIDNFNYENSNRS